MHPHGIFGTRTEYPAPARNIPHPHGIFRSPVNIPFACERTSNMIKTLAFLNKKVNFSFFERVPTPEPRLEPFIFRFEVSRSTDRATVTWMGNKVQIRLFINTTRPLLRCQGGGAVYASSQSRQATPPVSPSQRGATLRYAPR